MDYIYIDSQGKKSVGEVDCIEITPNYEFTIKIDDESIWCMMNHASEEWCIHLIQLQKQVQLTHPTDVFWNTEALYEVLQDVSKSKRMAYAIKSVYEICNYENVSI